MIICFLEQDRMTTTYKKATTETADTNKTASLTSSSKQPDPEQWEFRNDEGLFRCFYKTGRIRTEGLKMAKRSEPEEILKASKSCFHKNIVKVHVLNIFLS